MHIYHLETLTITDTSIFIVAIMATMMVVAHHVKYAMRQLHLSNECNNMSYEDIPMMYNINLMFKTIHQEHQYCTSRAGSLKLGN